MLKDFQETSVTGITLMRLLKISCIWMTFCIILCFLHSIFTHTHIHIHTYIHTCMYFDVDFSFCWLNLEVSWRRPEEDYSSTWKLVYNSTRCSVQEITSLLQDTCMYVNVSENYLFVPNAVLKSMCMLYLSQSLCYIDSLYNWHMMRYVIFWVNQFK